jgi:hypothetical protein
MQSKGPWLISTIQMSHLFISSDVGTRKYASRNWCKYDTESVLIYVRSTKASVPNASPMAYGKLINTNNNRTHQAGERTALQPLISH